MSEPRGVEPPCEVTGKPCEWVSEDELDEDGNIVAWDLFCQNCCRFREWELDEMKETE